MVSFRNSESRKYGKGDGRGRKIVISQKNKQFNFFYNLTTKLEKYCIIFPVPSRN